MGRLAAMLKEVDNNFVFTGIRMDAYIPLYYDNGTLFEENGGNIQVFGLFPIKVFDQNGKVLFEETFNIPSMIYMYPTEITREETTFSDQLANYDESADGDKDSNDEDDIDKDEVVSTKYIVARFFTNDVITHTEMTSDVDNSEIFLRLLCGGKIPHMAYGDVLKAWQMNLKLNNVNIGITSTIQEAIIREIYRNPNKREETFGEYRAAHPKVSEYGYKAVNIREICARNSTFAAMSFEDIDSMVTYSLNINTFDKEEKVSPVEKIIKM